MLQGLETYITTEKFLHTLETASAEWIDLSDHQQHPHKGWSIAELELPEVGKFSDSCGTAGQGIGQSALALAD